MQALYALRTVTDALASQHPNDFGFAFELARVFAQMGSLTDFRPVDTQALFSLLKVRDGPRDKFANPHVQEDAAECLEHVLVRDRGRPQCSAMRARQRSPRVGVSSQLARLLQRDHCAA